MRRQIPSDCLMQKFYKKFCIDSSKQPSKACDLLINKIVESSKQYCPTCFYSARSVSLKMAFQVNSAILVMS